MGDGRDCVEGRSPDSTRPLREGDSRRAGTLLTVPLRRSGLTGSESVETQRGAQVGGQGPGMGAELAGARRPGVEPPSSRSQGPGEGARSSGCTHPPLREPVGFGLRWSPGPSPLCARHPLPRPLPLGCCSYHSIWGLCKAIWSVLRKTGCLGVLRTPKTAAPLKSPLLALMSRIGPLAPPTQG